MKTKSLVTIDTLKLDVLFEKYHEIEFKKFDCLTCANCCRNYSPIIEPTEIVKLQNAIGVESSVFFSKYVEMDEDGDFVFRSQPCPMLNLETNKCNIYELRPKACAEYPHTNMKKIKNHLDLLEKNIDICPVANVILENVLIEINQ